MSAESLGALLSHALVAYTIEFDNAFEDRMPHATTRYGVSAKGRGPWLVSLVMYANCMRYVDERGIKAADLVKAARAHANLHGMHRWGYVKVAADKTIRATANGLKARELWRPLFAEIEERWAERFGSAAVHELRAALTDVVAAIRLDLPDGMPILGYGLTTQLTTKDPAPQTAREGGSTLAALLSKALTAWALGFERHASFSLAIYADVLRHVAGRGARVRDLPLHTGISKEAVATALSFLERQGFALIGTDPSAGRTRLVTLTEDGRALKKRCDRALAACEPRWRERFGDAPVERLCSALERIAEQQSAGRSLLLVGTDPLPNGWRAKVPTPNCLPDFPMVSHRGGFPDGS